MENPSDELGALRIAVQELTARIYRLEQRAGLEVQPPPASAPPPAAHSATVPAISPAVTSPVLPLSRPNPVPPRLPVTRPAKSKTNTEGLESTIGKLWLNRIGISAILIGVSYFIKYAFDNGWIGPSGKITLGLIAGIGLVLWSERFRSKGYDAFSYSLKALGIGTLYLSLWGAFQVYQLVPGSVAFVAMVLVTASTIALALAQDAEILAAFSIIGGFSTPVLLSSGQNHEAVLFIYAGLLDVAMLTMSAFKPWRRLLTASFVGTATLFLGWYADYYTKDQRPLTVFFSLMFAAIFAAIPLVTPLTRSRWIKGFSITLILLPLVNAASLFLVLFVMYAGATDTLTWYALALAAAYLLLSGQFKRRVGSEEALVKLINLMHIAIAIAFITIAVPLKLSAHWITMGWLIESAVLLVIGVRTKTDFLRYFAGTTLAMGILRLLVFDNFTVSSLLFNSRFATYLVAIAILAGVVVAGSRRAGPREMPLVHAAAISLNLLALFALTLEASDYFNRLLLLNASNGAEAYRQVQLIALQRNFSYSAIWLAYGAGLMIFGFWKRRAFVRWQALVLIAVTIAKVFLFDVSELQQGFRILSFIALGVVLMGISYAYHRDWLKLAPRAAEAPTPESPQ